jgi:hypothetical protein
MATAISTRIAVAATSGTNARSGEAAGSAGGATVGGARWASAASVAGAGFGIAISVL